MSETVARIPAKETKDAKSSGFNKSVMFFEGWREFVKFGVVGVILFVALLAVGALVYTDRQDFRAEKTALQGQITKQNEVMQETLKDIAKTNSIVIEKNTRAFEDHQRSTERLISQSAATERTMERVLDRMRGDFPDRRPP